MQVKVINDKEKFCTKNFVSHQVPDHPEGHLNQIPNFDPLNRLTDTRTFLRTLLRLQGTLKIYITGKKNTLRLLSNGELN